MEGSCVEQTAEKLCLLLQSVDEELSLLTEELLPPLRDPSAPGPSSSSSPSGAAATAAAAADPAEGQQQRAERRRELMELSAGLCVGLGQQLHAAISQQPPLTSSTSGTKYTCSKLCAANLHALRREMLALQALKEQQQQQRQQQQQQQQQIGFVASSSSEREAVFGLTAAAPWREPSS
ncbi:hypothetical protein Efla_006098 [Eimeria flavescens]